MDGLELNLFQSDTKQIKKKKKTVAKTRKPFLKKKINRTKQIFKIADKKKSSTKTEINQNKEISTIQNEFGSGLEQIKKKKVEINKINDKKISESKNDKFENKTNKFESNDQLKNDKSKEHNSNKFSSKSKTTLNNLEKNQTINNLAISMITDEFSDGSSLKRKSIDNDEDKHEKIFNNKERPLNRRENSRDKSDQRDRFNRNKNSNYNFNDKNHFKNKFNHDLDDQLNDNSNPEELKNDFNKLFASKGKLDRLESDKLGLNNSNKRFKRDEERPFKKEFISDCFRSNPEIPEIKLKNLKDEHKEDVFRTEEQFDKLKNRIHPHLISCLANKLNINKMTSVQSKSIPLIMDKFDCLIKSVTGSGKTLAYVIPIIQRIQEKVPKITRNDGIFALIIVPTRELVMQCYNILESLCKAFTFIVPSYLMGGENKHSEKNRIRKGINILVSTPGRLLDHIATTKNMNLSKVEILVIDEADRMYEAGFEESIKNILQFINEQKEEQPTSDRMQTILLSATLTSGVQNLAGIALKNDTKLIDTYDYEETNENKKKYTFPKNLKQYFCLVPAKLRLLALSSFIFKNCSFEKSSKLLIFMSTQDQVDFHYNLFDTTFNQIIKNNDNDPIEFFKLHGNMEQKERMKIFQKYKNTKTGVLLCTDVAARGLDLEKIEFVVQYTCPSSIEDYVHRIGRTARIEHKGSSMIFLLPSEINFLKYIQKELEANIEEMKVEEILKILLSFSFGQSRPNKCFREHASKLQYEFENSVHGDEEEKLKLARKAYLSFVRAYATHPRIIKAMLPFNELHLGHLCKSFGLRDAPRSLCAFKQDFATKKVDRSETEKFSFKFAKNKDIMRKRMQPIETKCDEFGSGF